MKRSTEPSDTSVSTLLDYLLFKNDTLFDQIEQTENEAIWNDLPPDDYRLLVKEKGSPDCNGYTKYFTIKGPPPLGITNLKVDSVTCFDGENGSITIEGTGGTGSYAFILSGPENATNNTGEFTGLKAGDYTLTVKNAIDCNDRYTHSIIKVGQPSKLNATISKQDISCNGLTDGKISASITGGTIGAVGYDYMWEMRIGTTWTPLSVTDPTLTGRGEGEYRLRVTDANGCSVISNEVQIIEPSLLTIEEVKVRDIQCFGEKGNIEVETIGGTPPYTFEYAIDSNPIFASFTDTTPLNPGNYTIRVVDKNGCTFEYAEKKSITAPPSPLSFTAELSDYSGYNISCWGGSNGHATLTATGGNGTGYSGYEYALDDGAFQAGPKLERINAGEHTLRVRDGRGCIVAKVFTFTQTAEQLSTVLIEKQNVPCYGDNTGILHIKGAGGLPPYQYSIDGTTFLEEGLFNNLGTGVYDIIIKDRNGCDYTYTEEIETINPPMEIAFTVKDVSCFGGNDGTVSAVVTGGVPPFQYQWNNLSVSAKTAKGLYAGTYTLKVTDNAGCSRQAAVEVQQPQQALAMRLATVPVCYGKSNGSITITASGGTPPYRYSIDGGQHYQVDPLFTTTVGSYPTQVMDSKGCTTTMSTTIEQRNEKPEPDFLVATKRNALDTLVVTDISVPKPDSIEWVFDEKATVLQNGQWAPQLTFDKAGNYAISMTGYFDGCAYTVTKSLTLSPYDPVVQQEKLPDYYPIANMVVSPNPSNGTFTVAVVLNKKYNLSLEIYDVLGVKKFTKSWESIKEVEEEIDLEKAPAGIYLVRAVTESDAKEARIIINK